MKKFVSMLLVLTMLVTVFAGLAVTASAADAALSVYTQAGADGEKTLAKSYTAEELKKLAETKADGYGYQYFKKGEQAVVATLYRLAGSPEVTEKAAFTDVASGSYYEAAVAWAAKNEIASGTSATTFEPNKAVTREQLAKFLFNYAVYQGMDAVTLSENLSSFADHDTVSGYAVPAMQWAVGQGFINGTGGKLLPTGTATRCQFAAILNRFTAAQSAKA